MPDSVERGGCCRCCCSFIFTLGLTALFMWLSLRTSGPKISLERFYIPSLNKSLNSPKNTTLYFQVKLENTNKDKGVYYDPINVTFFDSPNTNHSIGEYTIVNFYQGHKKTARKDGNFNALGIDREAVFRAVSVNGSAVFRVDLAASVRYKIMRWKTKKHSIMVGGNVPVNDQGTKLGKKGIRLKSSAVKIGSCCGQIGALLASFLVLVNLW